MGSVANPPGKCPRCGRLLTHALNKENNVVIPLDPTISCYRVTHIPDGSFVCERDLNVLVNHWCVCDKFVAPKRLRSRA